MHCQRQDFGVICLYRPHAEACAAAAKAGAIGAGEASGWRKAYFSVLQQQKLQRGLRTSGGYLLGCWNLVLESVDETRKIVKAPFSAGGTHGVDFATVDSFQGRMFFENSAQFQVQSR